MSADGRLARVPMPLGASPVDLPEEARRHLKVLRLRPGDAFLACDGTGRAVRAVLLPQGRAELGEEVSGTDLAAELWLLVGLARGERFDRTVEKASELGATRITPVISERANVHEPGANRRTRWERLAAEAAALAGRSRWPEVTEPWSFSQALEARATRRWFLNRGERRPQGAWSGSLALLVGPEGGWSPDEVEAAQAAGWEPVGLGPLNLRVETAAAAALGLAVYLNGEEA